MFADPPLLRSVSGNFRYHIIQRLLQHHHILVSTLDSHRQNALTIEADNGNLHAGLFLQRAAEDTAFGYDTAQGKISGILTAETAPCSAG